MIGDILKRTRLIYGYKANEMSSLLNISNSYLSEIENNKKAPSLELLKKYADIFGIKASSLMLLAEEAEEAPNNQSQEFIKKMMARLVNFMSKSEVLSNEKEEGKI